MKIHMVKKGDTLYDLSQKYGISLDKLIEANPQLTDSNLLNVGDKVKIPSKSVSVSVPVSEEAVHKHVVKQGDSLWKISKAWGVSLKDMIDANPQLKNPNALLVGEIVNIPELALKDEIYFATSEGNVKEEGIIQEGKTFTGIKTETAPIQSEPPVIPQLPQLPVNISPIQEIPAPIQQIPTPVQENPVAPIAMKEEKVEMSQHLYFEFPVPTKEVVAQTPIMEKSQVNPGFTENAIYPGLAESNAQVQPQFEQPLCEQPYYEYQGYWQQPQYVQSSFPAYTQMTYDSPYNCNPNISPYGVPSVENTYGGYSDNLSAMPNLTAPTEMVPITDSNIYSCTHPYEWTFPPSFVQSNNLSPSNMSYGANISPYPQKVESQTIKDCGCHSREEDILKVNQQITQESNIETNKVQAESSVDTKKVVTDKKLETVKISSVKKEDDKSANKVGKTAPSKTNKKKSISKRHRNPWIKN
ncbi:LysM peptidoglycan-binding domain-containing protein [Paenibacillus crassostreae]|uniref:LysM domain-containing protein n=1 Tax=Paenibacillus crassostreae TaxID=1763538 RepID=A0A167EF06_9BACL|nr:LysM peptidoglycan-binding domain-containing protein [Paenibacillus crassostreae]AOZ91893.1 hypothetical protein LPB68_06460 [Paenibacillus crassostreae]OAB75476.1 hypothetical protein PNBC_08935 [Paenibacillus crassostreae]